MKITRAHADFWLLKKAPAFLRATLEPKTLSKGFVVRPPFDINALIPEPDNKIDKHFHIHNTISLLKSYRRQGKDVYNELRNLAASPHSTKERRSMCSRWWRRIRADRLKKIFPDGEKTLDIAIPI